MKPVTRTFDEDTPLLTAEMARESLADMGENDGGWNEDWNIRWNALRAIASGRAVVRPAGDTPGAESEVVKDAARGRYLIENLHCDDFRNHFGCYTNSLVTRTRLIDEAIARAALSGASGTTKGEDNNG